MPLIGIPMQFERHPQWVRCLRNSPVIFISRRIVKYACWLRYSKHWLETLLVVDASLATEKKAKKELWHSCMEWVLSSL
jgi:hypothetical protein